MSEHEHEPGSDREPGRSHGETLPEGSPAAGEAALRKGDVETDEPKAGKGGDHPTPGAGEHDDPNG